MSSFTEGGALELRFDINGRCKLKGSIKRGGGRIVYTGGGGKFTKDSDRVREFNMEGLLRSVNMKSGSTLTQFSYYDPDKSICKLCYEEILPRGSKENGYIMINKLDGTLHRRRLGRKWYCVMAK